MNTDSDKLANMAVGTLIKCIQTIVNKILITAKFDITIKGKIEEVVNKNGIYIYKAIINGGKYNIKYTAGNSEYKPFDTVWITVPCGNYSNMIILGKSE